LLHPFLECVELELQRAHTLVHAHDAIVDDIQFRVELVEPRIGVSASLREAFVEPQRREALVDLPKVLVDLPEVLVDLPEVLVDLPEALLDLPEAFVETKRGETRVQLRVERLVQTFFEFGEGCAEVIDHDDDAF
jgi:hypothetical protein